MVKTVFPDVLASKIAVLFFSIALNSNAHPYGSFEI